MNPNRYRVATHETDAEPLWSGFVFAAVFWGMVIGGAVSMC